MRTLIVARAVRILLPVFILFSVYVFFRGHNLPGGGFIAALVASIGYILYVMGCGVSETERVLRVDAISLTGIGLLTAFFSAILPLFLGYHFLEGLWVPFKIPLIGKVGTPTLFDLGVYLLVIGITLKITFSITEDD